MAAGQRLPGMRAVVTGGASGIGAAVVRRFTAEGASVLAADVEGGDVLVDVTSSASVEAAIADIVDRLGGIDVVAAMPGSRSSASSRRFPSPHGTAAWRSISRASS